jgi:predicted dehydrogenase
MATASGATAVLRIAGNGVASHPGCPFWVHGTSGTLRGSVLGGSDRLEVDDGRVCEVVPLQGAWFVDGFAAAMAELMRAVAEDRQPENSAADAAESVRLVLAARQSVEHGGGPVEVGPVEVGP